MPERSPHNFPKELAKRCYTNMGTTMMAGMATGNFFEDLFTQPESTTTLSTAVNYGLFAASLGANLGTYGNLSRCVNKEVTYVSPSEKTHEFIKKQLSRLSNLHISLWGSGALLDSALKSHSPMLTIGLTTAALVGMSEVEERISRIGSSITAALETPYHDPPELSKIQ